MASFTDNIPQFNSYIQQLPVEAMVKVGMEKQQRYDEGLQKIQSNIQQVAGLDLLRPVDKQYLTSKLNELGGNLQAFAASDFSNFQLVNSVGGMVNQISKDPFVLAGVKSTAIDRKNTEEMEADREKGLLTEHAKYFYERQRDAYLNNPNIADESGKPVVFTSRYNRSFDIDKAMSEAIKNVGDSKWSAENVFVTDPLTGRIKRDIVVQKDPKTGKMIQIDKGPMLSPYAVKEIREGRFSENVQAAIEGVLSRPEAKQELLMQGVYNYRNFEDKQSFVKYYQSVKDEGIALLEEKRLDLLSKKSNETDPVKQEQYEKLLISLENQRQELESTEAEKLQQLNEAGSLDMYKGALQTQLRKNNWLKQFVTERTSISYEKSAPWEAHRQQIEDERNWWKSQDDSRRGWANVNISRQNAELEAEKWLYDEKNPRSPNYVGNGKMQVPFERPQGEFGHLADFLEKGAAVEQAFESNKNDFVVDYIMSLNYNNGKNVTREQVVKDINKFQSKDPNFINRQYLNAKRDVNKNPKAFPTLASGLSAVVNSERELEKYANEIKEINNSPEVIAAGANLDFSNIGKGIKPFTVVYDEPDDAMFTFTGRSRGLFQKPKQISLTFDTKDIINASIVGKAAGTGTPAERQMTKTAETALTSKFGRPIGEILAAVGITNMSGAVSGGILMSKGVDKQTAQTVRDINQAIIGKLGTVSIKAKEEALKKRQMGNSPLSYSIYPKDAKDTEKESINNNLKTYLNTFTEAGIDVSKFEAFYSGKDKDRYNVAVGVNRGTPSNPDKKISLDLYDGANLIQSIPITENNYIAITGRPLVVPRGVSDVARKMEWNLNTQSTNSIVSNPKAPNALDGAYYQPDDLSVQDRRVQGADIFKSYGGYTAYFYVNTGNKVEAIPVYDKKDSNKPIIFPNADAAETYIRGLSTPSQISYIIDNSKK